MEASEEQQQAEQVAQLEMVVKQKMTKDAIERYGNVKAAHPDKAMKVLQVIGSGIQSGQLSEMIDGEQLKELLQRLDTPQREVTINKV
tara:strand:+ start:845 stop:1108 length:264 start_codon:yes stop_codon:yes gene_type:complete